MVKLKTNVKEVKNEIKIQSKGKKYEGECRFCKQSFKYLEIVEHLNGCKARESKESKTSSKALRILIVADEDPQYWLIIEISSENALQKLDVFLRGIWLECCGHMSQFGDYGNKLGMKRKVAEAFKSCGEAIPYTYDFGTETNLTLFLLGESKCELNKFEKVNLLARNYLPYKICKDCKSKENVKWLCSGCQDDFEHVYLCEACKEKNHTKDSKKKEHFVRQIVNSPRVGVCGYEADVWNIGDLFEY